MGEGLKLVEFLEEAEELHGDAGGDHQETHGEDDQGSQLTPRAEDLVHKIFKHW